MVEQYSITKKEEVYNLLKNKRNFEYMSESLLRQLIDVMKVVRFRDEKTLIKQGAENAYCYIIIKGSVSVYVDGKFIYKLRRTGDVFGEISFVTQRVSMATIKADKDLGVVVISFDFFNKLENAELALWLARIIGEKLIRTSKLKGETDDVENEYDKILPRDQSTESEIPDPSETDSSESETALEESESISEEIDEAVEAEIEPTSTADETLADLEENPEEGSDGLQAEAMQTEDDDDLASQPETDSFEVEDDLHIEQEQTAEESDDTEAKSSDVETIDLEADLPE